MLIEQPGRTRRKRVWRPQAVELARKEAGLTQRELADRLELSLWEVDRLESGVGSTTVEPRHLSEAVGKPIRFFLTPPERTADSEQDVSRAASIVGRAGSVGHALRSRARSVVPVPIESRLVLASIAALVLVRFFTEVVVVLPRAANFVDIPILLVLTLIAARRVRAEGAASRSRFGLLAALFLALCVLATIVNPGRVLPMPVLVFVYGFLGPLGIYAAVHRLWQPGHAANCTRFIAVLGLVQLLVVAFIDVPRFLATSNPDVVSGTFGENAYQLVFFLLVFAAMASASFTFERRSTLGRFAPLILAAILGTILLAQYRALLATTALTLLVVGFLLGAVKPRGIAVLAVIGCTFYVGVSYISSAFPVLALSSTITDVKNTPILYVEKRWQALSTVAELYEDRPTAVLTGTGPGTFSSRAWATFAFSASESDSNVAGSYALKLTGGRPYRTDVSDEYVIPRYKNAEVVNGSRAISTPLSSYVALLAEVGVVGFVLLVAIYLIAMLHALRMVLTTIPRAQADDPLPPLLLGAFAAFFVLIQMAVLENWLEVTRVTFLAWALLAIATREFEARFSSQAT